MNEYFKIYLDSLGDFLFVCNSVTVALRRPKGTKRLQPLGASNSNAQESATFVLRTSAPPGQMPLNLTHLSGGRCALEGKCPDRNAQTTLKELHKLCAIQCSVNACKAFAILICESCLRYIAFTVVPHSNPQVWTMLLSGLDDVSRARPCSALSD